jgi:putative DNA primase/helicase
VSENNDDESPATRAVEKAKREQREKLAAQKAAAAMNGEAKSQLLADANSTALAPADKTLLDVALDGSDTLPSDYRGALIFVEENWHELRYVQEAKSYFYYNGAAWVPDPGKIALGHAEQIAEKLYALVGICTDPQKRQLILKFARHAERRGSIIAMLELAPGRPRMRLTAGHLDVDPWLLNCGNGTIDLKTGILHPHDRAQLLSKCTNTEYDADASCPLWLDFLAVTFQKDAEVIGLIQRAVGYSLTGLTIEEIILILYGRGGNGKTTFLNLINFILGDYAIASPSDTFMSKKDKSNSNDLARLAGARFVSTVEPDEGRRINESLIKSVTSRDKIVARFLFKEFFEFTPTHTVWMGVNHKPVIKGTDHGIWRRIKLVPFTHEVPSAERDLNLEVKLKEEAAGILAWAVRGCLDWQRDGLGSAKAIDDATAAYRTEMDTFGKFLEDRCVVGPYKTATYAELYTAFKSWSEESGEKYPMTKTAFGLRLAERDGLEEARQSVDGKRVRFWKGISLA